MIRGLGQRSGAILVLTVLLAVVPASPAGADPVITVDRPADGTSFDTASVTITGKVTNNNPLNMVKDVSLSGDGAGTKVTCSASPCPFSWTVSFPRNGPYQLKVTATEATILLGTPGNTATATRSFQVAAPPAKPVLDRLVVNADRNVELSWSRNTEDDMHYYALFRRDPGGSEFRQVPGGRIDQPRTGAKVTFLDTGTSAFNGGDYAYRVVAVRNGADGTKSTEAKSEPSTAGTAAVPVPPTTTATTPPPGTPAPVTPGVTTTTARPGSAGGVDLSGFLASRPQAAPLAPITVPEPPDTGFRGTLPFGALPGDELEEGPLEAVPPPSRSTRSVFTSLDSGRPLVPIAGGLVLVLLAAHMRLLNRRIKAVPDADLPVDQPRPDPEPVVVAEPAPPARPARPAPLLADAPAPAPYDLDADEDAWRADWAPIDDELDQLDEAEPETEEPELDQIEPDLDLEPVAAWEPDDEEDGGFFDVELDIPDDVAVLVEPVEPVEPEAPEAPAGPEEIEVFEVVSPTGRRLARAGTR